MRILELEIQKVRGLPDLKLEPAGKTFVVYGPNGSGKSAVVDALDFLLTGRISRLTGKGTAGISLTKHGPHIDYTAKDATVRARIRHPGIGTPLTLTRLMSRPNVLLCDPEAPGVVDAIRFAQPPSEAFVSGLRRRPLGRPRPTPGTSSPLSYSAAEALPRPDSHRQAMHSLSGRTLKLI